MQNTKKAVISNKIYITYEKELELELLKKLSYILRSSLPGAVPYKIFNVHKVGPTLAIPAGRKDLIPEGHTVIDKRVLVPVEYPLFKFELRDSQYSIVEEMLQLDDNCVIEANPGFGKTFTCLAYLSALGQKALVVTSTTFLRDQWVAEVEKTLGFTPDIIGSGRISYNTPITIANIQGLTKYHQLLSKEFGVLVQDEVHRIGADSFKNFFNSNQARYKIGLTATPFRKDGRGFDITDCISPTLIKAPDENTIPPEIQPVFIPKAELYDDADIGWANKINILCMNPYFIEGVCDLVAKCLLEGHKVLVVGDRIEFLTDLHKRFESVSCLIIGSTPMDHRQELVQQVLDGKKSVIFSSQKIFSEGISVNVLSALILAVPSNNKGLTIQLVGRINRKIEGKLQPIVYDIIPAGNMAKRQYSSRLNTYIDAGFVVRETIIL